MRPSPKTAPRSERRPRRALSSRCSRRLPRAAARKECAEARTIPRSLRRADRHAAPRRRRPRIAARPSGRTPPSPRGSARTRHSRARRRSGRSAFRRRCGPADRSWRSSRRPAPKTPSVRVPQAGREPRKRAGERRSRRERAIPESKSRRFPRAARGILAARPGRSVPPRARCGRALRRPPRERATGTPCLRQPSRSRGRRNPAPRRASASATGADRSTSLRSARKATASRRSPPGSESKGSRRRASCTTGTRIRPGSSR